MIIKVKKRNIGTMKRPIKIFDYFEEGVMNIPDLVKNLMYKF